MKINALLLLLITAAAPALSQHEHHSAVQWKLLNESPPFRKSYNYQMISLRDTLWVLHPDGTWYTTDGKNWGKTPLVNIVKNHAFMDYVLFNGVLYGLGTFEGNIERFTLTSAIHSTSDMRSWKLVSANSSLPKRFFYHPFVFRNRIWIVGGSDGTNDFSDIWTSTDAVHWTKTSSDLPFGKRSGARFIVFRDSVYMLANDVWVSADGLRWMKRNERIVNENIFGYEAVVYDDAVWLIGCNRDRKFTSEVIVSRDGRTWSAQRTPWSPRGGVAAAVYKNKLFMTGGKYGGFANGQTEFVYSNDVWMMESK